MFKMANLDIRYLNKDFGSFKEALIEYAKAYYPTAYNDFTTASPGTMFIDMASYVGDVLSFYLDNQLQETFLEYAKQQGNLYSLAYMLGYRPKVTSAAIVSLDVYQRVPARTVGFNRQPDFSYALVIDEGMQVGSTADSSVAFYVQEKIDFTQSSSYSPTDINVYSSDPITGQPTEYLLKKSVQAISGDVKTATFTYGQASRFATATIQDSDIIEVTKVTDSSTGDIWYEVPYLAQNYILEPVQNTSANFSPSIYQSSYQVPYILQKRYVNKRFTSRFKTSGLLQLEFGAGINEVSSSAIIPDPYNVGIGTINGLTMLTTAFNPTNFVTTEDYGLAPSNTTLTVQYLAGGGARSNASAGDLTVIKSVTANYKTAVNPTLDPLYKATIATTNPAPAVGGGDGDTTQDLRLNTLAQFPAQLRAVTQQDYLGTVLSMPAKFGKVAKAYITKDDILFQKYQNNEPGEKDPLATSIYLLTYNTANQFEYPSDAMYRNIQTYLNDYRMMTDAIHLKRGYIINIGVSFDIVMRPNYSTRETLAECLTQLTNYFNRDKWEINQPIIVGQLYTLLDSVVGVQTVQKVEISNLVGISNGYSEYSYDIKAATLNNIIYPSLDPSIFEVRYPERDIQGRVVTF